MFRPNSDTVRGIFGLPGILWTVSMNFRKYDAFWLLPVFSFKLWDCTLSCEGSWVVQDEGVPHHKAAWWQKYSWYKAFATKKTNMADTKYLPLWTEQVLIHEYYTVNQLIRKLMWKLKQDIMLSKA